MDSIKRLNKALEYVEETLEGQIDNVVFSRIAACPMAVFQRFFVLVTGTTFNEYVRLRKLSRAALEILNTNSKIIDIALKYGYDSADTFCVAFKRTYGMTPTIARKNKTVLPSYDPISFSLSITHIKEETRMDKLVNHLESVAKSYDKGIDFGRRGIDLYEDLPEYITNDPDFPIWEMNVREESGSGSNEIKDYLCPTTNMKFIDLGCCLNLMFQGYDEWPSTYFGIDISSKTIELLQEFTFNKNIPIGSLNCASIHETPYEADFFDIGACIGVLEYFEKDFVEKAIIEIYRIMKPNGKIVIEIPNIENSACRIMALIEGHMGRADKFNISAMEFEDMVQKYFSIDKTVKVGAGAMIQYFLVCIK